MVIVVAVPVWGSRHWKLNYECHAEQMCELFQSNLDSKVRGEGADGGCCWDFGEW